MKPLYLKNTEIFRRLSEEDMAILSRICPKRSYARGAVLYHAGDAATDLHIIVEGQVKLVAYTRNGHERIFVICGPQDFIGETFLRHGALYGADAVALTDTVTCPVSRQQFLELALHAPQVVLTLMETMVVYLSACREQLGDVYAPIKERVVKALLEQVSRFGRPPQGDWVELKTGLRHSELAAMVGATRVSVSVAVAELREQGFLEGNRGSYRLHVPALRALSDPESL